MGGQENLDAAQHEAKPLADHITLRAPRRGAIFGELIAEFQFQVYRHSTHHPATRLQLMTSAKCGSNIDVFL